MSTRPSRDASTAPPARPIHSTAAPHVRNIDTSFAASPARSIDVASATTSPMRPINPVIYIEKVGKCMQLKNIYSNVKMQMLA